MSQFVLRFQAVLICLVFALAGCQPAVEKSSARQNDLSPANQPNSVSTVHLKKENPGKIVHVIVALCDNASQGIVPVPAKIGNGDDPANNLYWGAGFGVKTVFRRSKDWQLLASLQNPKENILERLVFKHRTSNVYLVADAYQGSRIRQSIEDFLNFSAGKSSETIKTVMNQKETAINVGGAADLLVYIGHDGLMDFSLSEYPAKNDEEKREAIILACISKSYFYEPLKKAGAKPLLWTTGLMAPEAYILDAALKGWMASETGEQIKNRAAEAYHQYQKCGLKAAQKLFASGWN